MVRKSQSLRSPWYLLWESVFSEKKSSHGGCREGLSSGRSIIKICYIKLKKINKIFYTLLGGDKIQKFWIYYIWNISSENLKVVAFVKKKNTLVKNNHLFSTCFSGDVGHCDLRQTELHPVDYICCRKQPWWA